ncbi:MAG: hypothetical protein WDM77_02185 [Steroidobacteraceae bacterium]
MNVVEETCDASIGIGVGKFQDLLEPVEDALQAGLGADEAGLAEGFEKDQGFFGAGGQLVDRFAVVAVVLA